MTEFETVIYIRAWFVKRDREDVRPGVFATSEEACNFAAALLAAEPDRRVEIYPRDVPQSQLADWKRGAK